MKTRLFVFILFGSFLLGLHSCSKYLDQVPDNLLQEDDIFKSLVNTEAYLAQVYAGSPDDFNQEFAPNFPYGGPWTGASDESNSFSNPGILSNQLNQSTWNNTVGSSYWVNWYKPVRTATDFISKIDGADPTEVSAFLRGHFKAEARAMRALYYFWMLRLYGPVPILKDVVPVNGSGDDILYARTPFDSCVNYIVTQLDSAYNEIEAVASSEHPADQPINNGEYGRITTGICKAYKEQVLMLAASPLFNGNKDLAGLKNTDGTQLVNQTYDQGKWKLAADAAKAFIDEFVPGTYDLYTEPGSNAFDAAFMACRDVVLNDWNKEWIFGKSMSGSAGRYQYDITPALSGYGSGVTKGGGFFAVNQTMVDAYFMANGKSIGEPGSGYISSGFSDFQAPYDVQPRSTFNQWVNREPRFYVGVTYNNSYWPNQGNSQTPVIVNFELDGNSGRAQNSVNCPSTGYVIRKQLSSNSNSRGWCSLRLAQIYLDYAEALNEYDPGNSDILKYLNLIRQRADVPIYGSGANDIPVPSSQSAMRTAIWHERQVELAFECVRYFDLRRWKVAPSTLGEDVYGMNVFADDDAFYQKTLIQKRRFLQRDYLWPVPNDEVLKDKYMVQNPGW